MFCDEALESIEAVAAGEMAAEGRIGAHLATCPDCASALERARRLDELLRERAAPPAPPQFSARTLARIRRARWRSEQLIDAGFNLAVTFVIIAIAIAVWMVLSRTGFSALGTDAVDLLASGLVAVTRRIAPSLPLYAGAAGLLASALVIWWWAERDVA